MECQLGMCCDSAIDGLLKIIYIKIFSDLGLKSKDTHTNTVFITVKIFTY